MNNNPTESEQLDTVATVDQAPAAVGVRELARRVSSVVNGVRNTGRPVVVTKHGQPYVAIVPIRPGAGPTFSHDAPVIDDTAPEKPRAGRNPPAESQQPAQRDDALGPG